MLKESSATTKTRVVFDASSKDSKEKTLNDALYKGPVLQSDLFSIIIRFRCFRYVLCANIKKMYRQILVHESQTSLQTILWREDSNNEVEAFELVTLTYGTKPASFLAVRCLQQVAEIEEPNFPVAAKVLRRDFYGRSSYRREYSTRIGSIKELEVPELLSLSKLPAVTKI